MWQSTGIAKSISDVQGSLSSCMYYFDIILAMLILNINLVRITARLLFGMACHVHFPNKFRWHLATMHSSLKRFLHTYNLQDIICKLAMHRQHLSWLTVQLCDRVTAKISFTFMQNYPMGPKCVLPHLHIRTRCWRDGAECLNVGSYRWSLFAHIVIYRSMQAYQ